MALSDQEVSSNVDRVVYFFFQAEDGIRDYKVTGVQTCALPIFLAHLGGLAHERVVVEVLQDLLVRHAARSSLVLPRRRLSFCASLVRTGRRPAMRGGVSRIEGPDRLSAAITSPVGPRTGAAIALRPTSSSSTAVAKSSSRIVTSSASSCSRSTTVCGVRRGRRPAGSSAEPKARNTLPLAVQW